MLALTCFWGSYLFSVLDNVVYALNLLSLEQCCEAKRGKKKHQATSIMNYLTRRNDENIMHEHQTLDFISTDSSIVIEFLVFSMPSVLFMWKNTAVFLKTMKICCIWKWKIWREMLNFYFLWLSFISHHVLLIGKNINNVWNTVHWTVKLLHYWFYKKEILHIQSQILVPLANTPNVE